jgi:hypothetical protein
MNADERKPTTNRETTLTRITLTSNIITTIRVTLETRTNDEVTTETTPYIGPRQDLWHLEPRSKAIRENEIYPDINAITATNSDI